MPRTLRIALAQFDFPVGDVAGNAARIAQLIAQARDVHRADLVLVPELALSGYPPEDLLLRPAFLADCQAALRSLAAGVEGIVAVVGWPEAAGSNAVPRLNELPPPTNVVLATIVPTFVSELVTGTVTFSPPRSSCDVT